MCHKHTCMHDSLLDFRITNNPPPPHTHMQTRRMMKCVTKRNVLETTVWGVHTHNVLQHWARVIKAVAFGGGGFHQSQRVSLVSQWQRGVGGGTPV